MSVITFPRRVELRPSRPVARPASARANRDARAAHRRASGSFWRSSRAVRRSSLVIMAALALTLAGSMLDANRQVQIHELQSQLLQDQSTYAVQVGNLTIMSAPSQIATKAGALHLVDPVSVTQVPSTSLDAPLPLPKFSGYAPVTSRTIR
ncbi:MAG: hypothetical protein WA786_08825 [Acidimicrobiales bacterium]